MPEYSEREAEVLALMRRMGAERGRAPTVAEWNAAGEGPSSSTVVKMFTSWSAAQRAAGLTPRRTGDHVAPRHNQVLADAQVRAAIARNDAGVAGYLIAEELGVNVKTLYSRMAAYRERHSMPRSPGGRQTDVEREAEQLADPTRDPPTAPPLSPKRGPVRSGRSRGR